MSDIDLEIARKLKKLDAEMDVLRTIERPVAGGGGFVSGGGTAPRIAEWTGAATIGDSTMVKTGANVVTVDETVPGLVKLNSLTVGIGAGVIDTNVAVGKDALANNTTGYSNTAIGGGALTTVVTGWQNTAVGTRALQLNTGRDNVAVGADTMISTTTGLANTAIGGSALHNNVNGGDNVAVGLSALYDNISGVRNTGVGCQALLSNTIGNKNTAVGKDALWQNIDGSGNAAIGDNAGSYITGGVIANTTSQDSIYIGRDTRALADDDTNEIIIGAALTGAGSNTATIGTLIKTGSVLTLTATAASTLALAITAGKTLTLTAIDDFNLTVPATGTVALLNASNSFTLINPLTTIAESWIGPSATTGIYFKGGFVGLGTIPPAPLYLFHVRAADGISDNSYVAYISNEEATANRNNGLWINAGSSASDYNVRGAAFGGAELWSVTGAGLLTAVKLALSATSNQIVLQSAGVTGTLTWTPAASNKVITLPNLTGNVALGADSITATSTNDVTVANHTHAAGATIARAADVWALLGNAGTDPAVNFVGTSDATDLILARNSAPRVRVGVNGVGIGLVPPVPNCLLDIECNTGTSLNGAVLIKDIDGGADGNGNSAIDFLRTGAHPADFTLGIPSAETCFALYATGSGNYYFDVARLTGQFTMHGHDGVTPPLKVQYDVDNYFTANVSAAGATTFATLPVGAGFVFTPPVTFSAAITATAVVNPLTTAAESWIGPSSTAGIYFKGGKAGFGTTAPGVRSDIQDGWTDTTFGGQSDALRVVNTQAANTANYRAGLWLRLANGIANKNAFIELVNDAANNLGDIAFSSTNAGTEYEWMRIKGNGYVGIGDAAPGDTCVVKQASTTAAISVLQLNQLDVDQPFVSFQGGTVYTGKTAADEYLMVKVGAGTRYIRLYT